MAFLGYAWASTVIRLNTEAELVPALLGLPGKGSTMFDHRIEDLHVQFSSGMDRYRYIARYRYCTVDLDIKYHDISETYIIYNYIYNMYIYIYIICYIYIYIILVLL